MKQILIILALGLGLSACNSEPEMDNYEILHINGSYYQLPLPEYVNSRRQLRVTIFEIEGQKFVHSYRGGVKPIYSDE